jgi:hypothetical protein
MIIFYCCTILKVHRPYSSKKGWSQIQNLIESGITALLVFGLLRTYDVPTVKNFVACSVSPVVAFSGGVDLTANWDLVLKVLNAFQRSFSCQIVHDRSKNAENKGQTCTDIINHRFTRKRR